MNLYSCNPWTLSIVCEPLGFMWQCIKLQHGSFSLQHVQYWSSRVGWLQCFVKYFSWVFIMIANICRDDISSKGVITWNTVAFRIPMMIHYTTLQNKPNQCQIKIFWDIWQLWFNLVIMPCPDLHIYQKSEYYCSLVITRFFVSHSFKYHHMGVCPNGYNVTTLWVVKFAVQCRIKRPTLLFETFHR